MRVMDVHVYGVNLVSFIFRRAFAHDTGPTSGFMTCRAISYNSRPHLVILQGKVNIARLLPQVVYPVILSFLRQEHVLFQHDSGCCDVTCSSWCTTTALASKIPRSLANLTRLGYDGNLLFLQSLPQPLPNCNNGCKVLGTVSQDDIRHFYDHFHMRLHRMRCSQSGYTWCSNNHSAIK